MNIEKNVEIIGDYFKKKVVKGDYQIIRWSDSTIDIIIDNKYNFSLWIYLNSFNFYTLLSTEKSIFHNALKFTDDEKKEGRKNYESKYIRFGKDDLKRNLEVKIKKLQEELNNL